MQTTVETGMCLDTAVELRDREDDMVLTMTRTKLFTVPRQKSCPSVTQ